MTMDIEFPCLVYKDGGAYQRCGGTFDYAEANNQVILRTLLSSGWYSTLPEAIANAGVEVMPPRGYERSYPVDTRTDPVPDWEGAKQEIMQKIAQKPLTELTLAELKIKAHELKVRFHPSIGYDNLLTKVSIAQNGKQS